jgi:hypothetical protein
MLAWFTGALVLATFCTIGVGIWQAVISQEAANSARDAVSVASRTLADTERSNKAQEELNKSTLDASIRNFQIEQRAWIELDPPKSALAPLADTPPGMTLLRFPMYLRNVGKTSAFDIKFRFYNPIGSALFKDDKTGIGQLQLPIAILRQKEVENVHRFVGPKVKVGVYEGFAVPGVLAPGVRVSAPFTIIALTPTEARKGRSPPDPLNYFTYLIGRVEYSDTFGTPHWMKFCLYVSSDEGDIQNCQYGNDEDRTLPQR